VFLAVQVSPYLPLTIGTAPVECKHCMLFCIVSDLITVRQLTIYMTSLNVRKICKEMSVIDFLIYSFMFVVYIKVKL
jgi:hypothetical protein